MHTYVHVFEVNVVNFCLKVSYWKDMEQEESGKKQRTVKNETSAVLTRLDGNSVYLIIVKGFNSIGQGPGSAAVTAQTRKARECSADSNRVLLYIAQRRLTSLVQKRCFEFDIQELCVLSSAPAQPPANLMWIQEGNNVSLSWDPVKATDNESDVIGYMVMSHFQSHVCSV